MQRATESDFFGHAEARRSARNLMRWLAIGCGLSALGLAALALKLLGAF